MKFFAPAWVFLALFSACSSRVPSSEGGIHRGFEKVKIGRFQSRALFRPADVKLFGDRAPVVIMLPGSGPNGPEEAMPGTTTVDGQDSFLFLRYAEALTKAGFNALLVGKPGVEYHSGWGEGSRFYNAEMYEKLKWQDLIDNARDAMEWAQTDKRVHPDRVWVLGHSEGTQVAVDFATTLVPLEGLILLGFSGEDLKTTLEWQLVERQIEWFVSRDVDKDHDGFITREEAAAWPEASFPFREGEKRVSVARTREAVRAMPEIKAMIEKFAQKPLYGYGVFDRGSQYVKAALVPPAIYAFTGELDVQTPAREAKKLASTCKEEGKSICHVKIWPGVGHAFSPPKSPRAQPFLDLTLGPPAPEFLDALTTTMREALGTPSVNVPGPAPENWD